MDGMNGFAMLTVTRDDGNELRFDFKLVIVFGRIVNVQRKVLAGFRPESPKKLYFLILTICLDCKQEVLVQAVLHYAREMHD
jgi:hypothetical protein